MSDLWQLKVVTVSATLFWFSISSPNVLAEDGAKPLGFVDELQSGPTLLGAAPELGEALRSIAGMADEYANLTLVDLKSMPNAEKGEDKGLFHVTVRESEGLIKEFWYNIKENCLSSVKVTRSDGSVVAVSMTMYSPPADEQEILSWPDLVSTEELADGRWLRATIHEIDGTEKVYLYNRQLPALSWISYTAGDGSSGGAKLRCPGRKSELRLTGGVMIQPGGQRRLFTYYDRGVSRTPSCAAFYDAETGEGRVTIWDADGAVIAECAVSNQPIPEFMIQEANAQLTVEQFDTLDMPARDRLVVSPAFRKAEIGLQRSMDNIAGWSDRYGIAMPSDLPYLFPGGNSQLARVEKDDVLEFRAIDNDVDQGWSYYYDQQSGALKRLERETFAVYFDLRNPGHPIGGRSGDTSTDQVWLISLYPGTCAPRMAVAAKGEPPTDLNVEGKLFVWGPDGEILVEESIETSRAVAEVVQEIDAALTEQEKQAVNWRGLQEANYLLGQY